MQLRPLPSESISSRVTNEIRTAIRTGDLKPGERLVERKLAETMGVSHIPIREALARLSEEGLVDRLPRRGARVAELTVNDLDEVTSLRVLLEQFVVVRVQERWEKPSETRLRKIVDSMVAAANRGATSRVLELDRQFHEVLWELAGHRLLIELATQLRGRIDGFLLAANEALAPEDKVAHALSHLVLLDAIASGDPDDARDAMSEHIGIAARRIKTTDAE